MRINDLERQFRQVFFDRYPDDLVNFNVVRRGREVVWDQHEGAIYDEPLTLETLAEISDRRQYSFQFVDGSMFQLRYGYHQTKDELVRASLAFYYAETSAPGGVIPWLRIDYAPDHENGLLHPAAHLHIYGIKECRISVLGIPTPLDFVDLIVSVFYPDFLTGRLLGTGYHPDFKPPSQTSFHFDRESPPLCYLSLPAPRTS